MDEKTNWVSLSNLPKAQSQHVRKGSLCPDLTPKPVLLPLTRWPPHNSRYHPLDTYCVPSDGLGAFQSLECAYQSYPGPTAKNIGSFLSCY